MAIENKDHLNEEKEVGDIDSRLIGALQQWVDKQENQDGWVVTVADQQLPLTASQLIAEVKAGTEVGKEELRALRALAEDPEIGVERLVDALVSPTVTHPGDIPDRVSGLLQWICIGGLRAPEATKVLKNLRFLDQQRTRLEGQYAGQWVASLDGEIYANPNVNSLLDSMQGMPNYHSAYIESIPADR